jgi:geranylgeranyl transferase type-1 subunit beta
MAAVGEHHEETVLNLPKQIQYWRRNSKTFLPHHYTGNDNNRMTLACFVLSAADLIGDLDAAMSEEDRRGYIEWVYHCQLPSGGFRPSPATDFGTASNEDNAIWDPAHMAGTFFALLILGLLRDDLTRVKRREILKWLNQMQRPDGSFGQTIGVNGHIEGGSDSRFGFMAAGIRWILRGNLEGPVDGVPDIDVDKFVQCVRDSETYDGGISEAPFHEAHAGFACCAISALSLLDRLPLPPSQTPDGRLRGVTNLPLTLHWLASRQTLTLDEDDALEAYRYETEGVAVYRDADAFNKLKDSTNKTIPEIRCVGLNGRCNKIADTCYGYWTCAPLHVLGYPDLVDKEPIQRWLLERTQHFIGGFGKLPGEPPDVYHSYLGLFTLAMLGHPQLKEVDPALCISKAVKEHLESLPWRRELLSSTSRNP